MVHLNGRALPEFHQKPDASASSLFDDLHHLNTLCDHREHNQSGCHAREKYEANSVQRTASTPRRSRPVATARGPRPLLPRSLKEALQLAELLSKSKLIPKGFETPETCLVGILYGMEVGLSPIAALQRMAVIDGRPTILGDAALALVQSSGLLQSIREEVIEDEDTKILIAICRVEREGRSEPVSGTFSVDDAKRAGLWQKPGPWTDYPKRMLTMRARAFALRDAFPDVLSGLYIREEFEGSKTTRSNPIERQKLLDKDEWAQAAHHRPSTDSVAPKAGSAPLMETTRTKSSVPTRRAPPPPPEICKNAEENLEISAPPELVNPSPSNLDQGDQNVFDPEIILDLFDSALSCALDLPILEEIIDEFAERLRKLPDDAQQRAQRIIERHHKRAEELDRSPATDQSASAGTSNADHNQLDPGADRHEARSDAEFNAGDETATLPRGLMPLLSNLGVGRMPRIGWRRNTRDTRSRSFASWNARTRLSTLSEPESDQDVLLTGPMETEE